MTRHKRFYVFFVYFVFLSSILLLLFLDMHSVLDGSWESNLYGWDFYFFLSLSITTSSLLIACAFRLWILWLWRFLLFFFLISFRKIVISDVVSPAHFCIFIVSYNWTWVHRTLLLRSMFYLFENCWLRCMQDAVWHDILLRPNLFKRLCANWNAPKTQE